MIPYVRVELTFEPDRGDIGDLYEEFRAIAETVRPFGIRSMNFHVTVRNEDDALPAF